MMTLAAASAYFDRTQVFDAYSGAPLFLAQVDPYDDSKRDAMVAFRRILSVAPTIAMPAHRAVRIFGSVWIISGEPMPDGLEEVHRAKYVIQMCDGALGVGSISDFLAGAPRSTAFGFPSWVKDAKAEAESSDIANLFEVVFAHGTPVRERDVIWRAGRAFLALSVRQLASDFVAANALELEQALPQKAVLQARQYSPALGEYELGPTVTSKALRVRWQSLFRYDAQMDERFQEGDFTLALPAGVEVTTSTRIQFEGLTLGVMGVSAFEDGVAVHVRRL